jgi:hypothetical protein
MARHNPLVTIKSEITFVALNRMPLVSQTTGIVPVSYRDQCATEIG